MEDHHIVAAVLTIVVCSTKPRTASRKAAENQWRSLARLQQIRKGSRKNGRLPARAPICFSFTTLEPHGLRSHCKYADSKAAIVCKKEVSS
jgi:hypothetical protein